MNNRCKKYLKISFWIVTITNLIFFFSFLVVALSDNNPSFFYGFLLCFLLPYTILFLTFIKWRIFSLTKTKKSCIDKMQLECLIENDDDPKNKDNSDNNDNNND